MDDDDTGVRVGPGAEEAMAGLRVWLEYQANKWPGLPRDSWLRYKAEVMFCSDGSFRVDKESLTKPQWRAGTGLLE